jgi:Heterokaryon incompatibility protein (HET)
MRLLRCKPDGGFELIKFDNDDLPPYAILSHTWAEEEVTYDELAAGDGKNKAGYAKLRFCSERATKDGVSYFWVDTCCIDKRDSTELSAALNSMFRWYQRATKCYVYLSDVHVADEVVDAQAFRITWEDAFRRGRWFSRGWTLQELLAPASVEFFSANGKQLGSKITLEREIHEITQIPIRALRKYNLREFSVDERMRWAAGRETTVKEDRAYCLLGIFGVFLPPIYGEGEQHALQRLKEEVQKRFGQLHGLDVTNVHKIPSMLSIIILTAVWFTDRSLATSASTE